MCTSVFVKQWLCVASLSVVLAGCEHNSEPSVAPVKQVDVVEVTPRPLQIDTDLAGRVTPVRVAEVRARVPGIVVKRAFEEGADVKAGQILFQIDPAPYKAALSRAEGELAKIEAEVRFLGVDNTIEIWSKTKLEEPLIPADKFSEELQRLMNN